MKNAPHAPSTAAKLPLSRKPTRRRCASIQPGRTCGCTVDLYAITVRSGDHEQIRSPEHARIGDARPEIKSRTKMPSSSEDGANQCRKAPAGPRNLSRMSTEFSAATNTGAFHRQRRQAGIVNWGKQICKKIVGSARNMRFIMIPRWPGSCLKSVNGVPSGAWPSLTTVWCPPSRPTTEPKPRRLFPRPLRAGRNFAWSRAGLRPSFPRSFWPEGGSP